MFTEPARGRGTIHSIERARSRRSRGQGSRTIRVLVVGGHALTRAGLTRLLEEDADLAVVGAAADRNDAAALVGATDPHVVLVDAGSREPDPASYARLLGRFAPVLLLTDCDADDRVVAALRSGATGVLAMDSHPAELASAVRTLAAGGALLSPRTTRRLIRELVSETSTTAPR
jgi:DNA-binding NarL/FixJ family response regulator